MRLRQALWAPLILAAGIAGCSSDENASRGAGGTAGAGATSGSGGINMGGADPTGGAAPIGGAGPTGGSGGTDTGGSFAGNAGASDARDAGGPRATSDAADGEDTGDAAASDSGGIAPAPPPSCDGLAATCGPSGDEDCCASRLVPGGTFYRGYDGVTFTDQTKPATISDFYLDRFEVTVARFRKFVGAVAAGWLPAAGSGKHAHLHGGSGLSNNAGTEYETGWDTAWNAHLPASEATWAEAGYLGCAEPYPTWTAAPGSNEMLPVTCVSWYQAYAFCIWDGGFLPSETEWNYAAAGGSEQRVYPWGAVAPGTDANLAVYGCYYNGTGTCTGTTNIAAVGSVPAGDGRYDHADLAGNVFEWNLDWDSDPYMNPCDDCTVVAGALYRVLRGGSFVYDTSFLPSSRGTNAVPHARYGDIGVRCARTP